ncbi:glutathione S-transferase [Auriculariales sp. MPI-PUGE-AT-0066]|nr:glutathione S-transferase [Auriculariales sp. MPI-PUGE-AT-0066]
MPAAIVLHGAGNSTCVRRVAVVCKMLDVEYERKDVAWDAIKTPEHLKIHPFGQVPIAIDSEDGFTLYESRAISRYVVAKYGKGSSLVPPASDFKATARFEIACSIEQANFDKIVFDLAYEKISNCPHSLGQTTDEERVSLLYQQLEPKLDGYERILSQAKYLAGDTLTIADLFHLPYGHLLESGIGSDVLQKRPNVARWWNELMALPAWQAVKDSA